VSTPESVVIVGGGLAGAKAAEALRDKGFDGPVTLIGDETDLPYERPPLSKAYLAGQAPFDDAVVHPRDWYDEHHVELRLGVRASSLDTAAHEVGLADGTSLRYGRLLLATGAVPRRLRTPGADAEGVLYLRKHADADAIRAVFGEGNRLVIIGAGWIGLEVAAAARHHDNAVTIVEPQPTPLHAVLGQELGARFAQLHRDHGVDLFTDTTVREFRGDGAVSAVVTTAHAGLPADLVVVGVGAIPRIELAAAAGLEVDNGIVTDHALRTSAPDVYAAGDVASSFRPLYGRHLRVEHWANALNSGPAAARSMLGQDDPFDPVPYFFTDQYDLGMEYSGLAGPGAKVVYRGDPDDGEYIAFWLEDGRVTAGMNVNVWDVADPIQALIRTRQQVPVAALTDPDTPLERLAG
jgi:3-phenylpropionate/trans-cinnamate dioxygenase ferredoxin reductase subunit